MSAFSSLASVIRGGVVPKAARCYLSPLPEDVIDPDQPDLNVRSFQYYPETIQDTRGINYQSKEIPGLSHPLYQWTWGGARQISFVAVLSRDRALRNGELDQILQGGARADDRNVDIPSAIGWLRSYTYPEYEVDGQKGFKRPRPPRRIVLTLPGLRLNQGSSATHADDMNCIMTQCEVEYPSFFNDGTPRLARVQLAFDEIIQYGQRINPVSAAPMREQGLLGYNITVKR